MAAVGKIILSFDLMGIKDVETIMRSVKLGTEIDHNISTTQNIIF
jgi:hypothetical protein